MVFLNVLLGSWYRKCPDTTFLKDKQTRKDPEREPWFQRTTGLAACSGINGNLFTGNVITKYVALKDGFIASSASPQLHRGEKTDVGEDMSARYGKHTMTTRVQEDQRSIFTLRNVYGCMTEPWESLPQDVGRRITRNSASYWRFITPICAVIWLILRSCMPESELRSGFPVSIILFDRN